MATWPTGFPMFCGRGGYQAWAFPPAGRAAHADARERQTDTQCNTDDMYVEAEFVTDSSNWPGSFITFVATKYIQERVHFKEVKNNMLDFNLFLPQAFSQQEEKELVGPFFSHAWLFISQNGAVSLSYVIGLLVELA